MLLNFLFTAIFTKLEKYIEYSIVNTTYSLKIKQLYK